MFVSEQHLQQQDVDRIVNALGRSTYVKVGATETQLWGVPWTEGQFAKQMVNFGHPAELKSGLPMVLSDVISKYRTMDVQERMAYRASRLGYWLKMMVSLKEEESALKQQIDGEVLKVWFAGLWPAKFQPASISVLMSSAISLRWSKVAYASSSSVVALMSTPSRFGRRRWKKWSQGP